MTLRLKVKPRDKNCQKQQLVARRKDRACQQVSQMMPLKRRLEEKMILIPLLKDGKLLIFLEPQMWKGKFISS